MELGDKVRTLADNGSRDFNVHARRDVKWGVEGVITRTDDAHGEAFCVDHGDGTVAWYEATELEVIDPSPELKALLASLGFLRQRSVEAAKFAFPIGTPVRFVPADDYEHVEVRDIIVGDPYEVRANGETYVKLPTRHHGGVLLEDLRVNYRTVLQLRALAHKDR